MVLSALRTRTHLQHVQLEARLDLLRDDLTLDQYALLQHLLRLYTTLEPQLGSLIPVAWQGRLEWSARLKCALLQRDLSHLGKGVLADGLSPVLMGTEAAAWGALYVLEGATLGGQLICRHLGPQLGLNADAGLGFYASYRELVGPRWKAFCTLITERAESDTDPLAFEMEAVLGAQTVFSAFERWVVTAWCPAPSSLDAAPSPLDAVSA